MKRKLEKLKMPPMRSKGKLDLNQMMDNEDNEKPGDEDKESPEYQDAEDKYGLEQHGDADEGSPEEEAGESPAEEQMEDEGQESENGPLAHVDDEDLMAEIKKRGLMDKLLHGDNEDEKGMEDMPPRSDSDSGSSSY